MTLCSACSVPCSVCVRVCVRGEFVGHYNMTLKKNCTHTNAYNAHAPHVFNHKSCTLLLDARVCASALCVCARQRPTTRNNLAAAQCASCARRWWVRFLAYASWCVCVCVRLPVQQIGVISRGSIPAIFGSPNVRVVAGDNVPNVHVCMQHNSPHN